MLVNIGSSGESEDIVSLLLACHDRIRFFTDLAMRLAATRDLSLDEIRETAKRIARYFTDALPLHVADEEESIIPRLSGRESTLDAALQAMHSQHEEHEQQLDLLLKICRQLQASPEQLPVLSEALRDVSSRLSHAFTSHLNQEEAIVLPAIKSLLSKQEQETMFGELRARRSK